ncbi:hypothetical protein J4Q44_G00341230 [Coregonus suidteri]|uniref:Uncharacterized protein n=1 Tax=Coregonus suidteri TaxID=861788 RepID=A0AAN8KP62_9TELE
MAGEAAAYATYGYSVSKGRREREHGLSRYSVSKGRREGEHGLSRYSVSKGRREREHGLSRYSVSKGRREREHIAVIAFLYRQGGIIICNSFRGCNCLYIVS